MDEDLELMERAYVERDGHPIGMTIVRRRGAENLPVLLNIHGGGWCAGSRDRAMSVMARDRAHEGYLFLDADYRLAPFRPYPAACDDLRAAIDWIVAHAAEYGGDASRIGVFGWSAGGHLASLLALTSHVPITCGVSWDGDTDLCDPELLSCECREGHRNCILAFLGACIHDDPDLYRRASPVNYLSPQAPPLLIIHGECDTVVPVSQAYRMRQAAEEAGAPVEVRILIGAGHMDQGPQDPDGQIIWSCIRRFLADHLKPARTDQRG